MSIVHTYKKNTLTYLVNQIITTNSFPTVWEEALMTPVPKPGTKTNPSNYRPISSLPILSKVTEKLIAQQIRQYTETNMFISRNQFGVRKNNSNQTLLLQLTNRWLRALDNAPSASLHLILKRHSTRLITTYSYQR